MNFDLPPQDPHPEKPKSPQELFQDRLQDLLASGAPLYEVVQILGAEEFLKKEGPKGKEGLHFDVKAFTEEQFQEGQTPIELPGNFTKLPDTILPPGEGEIKIGSGNGLEQKALIPRTRVFIELLSELKEPYSLISGTNTEEMMRGETYRIFLLAQKEKLFFINDEEGNATFVVHKALSDTWQEYAGMTKGQLKELPIHEVEAINYPGSLEDWRARMETALFTTSEELKKGIDPQRKDEKVGVAPEGWLTVGALMKRFNSADVTIKKIADPFRESHPGWFQEYSYQPGKTTEHYHPDLVQKIEESFETLPDLVPEGWYNKNTLAEELKVGPKTVFKVADSLRDSHPDLFQNHRNVSGRVYEYYHPDLASEIRRILTLRPEQAPAGWLTGTALAEELNADRETIRKKAEVFKDIHPEWFQVYAAKNGESREHYHPELIDTIREAIHSLKKAPEGWMTAGALRLEFGNLSSSSLARIVDPFRETHPFWFELYTNKTSRSTEHYHPDLVKEIKEKRRQLTEIQSVPDGWKSNKKLSDELRVSERFLRSIAESLRSAHPEWVTRFRDNSKAKRVVEFYHPDFVEEIRKEIESRPDKASEGWYTNAILVHQLHAGTETIEDIVKSYRSTNPEWFQKHRTSNNLVGEYFHPDLVAIIKKSLALRLELAPDNWKTNSALSQLLGVEFKLMKKIAASFRETHPEWFKEYSYQLGKTSEHYHPDLVQKIKEEIESRPGVAPDDWYTASALSEDLGISHKRVLRIAASFRETHPEWFNKFLHHKKGEVFEYYHPELVERIKEEVVKKKA